MKTKLFTEETESYTSEANQIAFEFENAIRPIFNKYFDKHHMRELEIIAYSSIAMVTIDAIFKIKHIELEKRVAEMTANLADTNLVTKVRELAVVIKNGNPAVVDKITAIKALRQLTGMGLVDAKNWVESNMEEFKP